MTLDGASGGDCYLVSYDVSGAARSAAARVCQIVFGRRRIVEGKTREEPGFVHRAGVVWMASPYSRCPRMMRTTSRPAFSGSESVWPWPR